MAATAAPGEVPAKSSKAPISHHHIRQNLSYLVAPSSTQKPGRLRTRAILKTLRYATVFIFWRLIRSLRYALVGSIVGAIGSTMLAPFTGPLAFVIAPPGIIAGAGMGLVWAFARYRWKRFAKTVKDGKVDGADARGDERNDAADGTRATRAREERVFRNVGSVFDPAS
jgi:hypothetical protein